MTDIYKNRKMNIRAIIGLRTIAQCARLWGITRARLHGLTSWNSGSKCLTTLARRIEEVEFLPALWIDRDHGYPIIVPQPRALRDVSKKDPEAALEAPKIVEKVAKQGPNLLLLKKWEDMQSILKVVIEVGTLPDSNLNRRLDELRIEFHAEVYRDAMARVP